MDQRKLLTRAREAKQLTKTKLSELSGVHRRTIHRIEQGLTIPTKTTLKKLFDAIGMAGTNVEQVHQIMLDNTKQPPTIVMTKLLPHRKEAITNEITMGLKCLLGNLGYSMDDEVWDQFKSIIVAALNRRVEVKTEADNDT